MKDRNIKLWARIEEMSEDTMYLDNSKVDNAIIINTNTNKVMPDGETDLEDVNVDTGNAFKDPSYFEK